MGDKIFDTDEKSVRRSLNSQQKDGEKLQISDNRPCSVSQVQMKRLFREFLSGSLFIQSGTDTRRCGSGTGRIGRHPYVRVGR